MKKALELIEQKKEEYRDIKQKSYHDIETAKRLGFDVQVQRIQTDIKWAKDIIYLLDDIGKELQAEKGTTKTK